MAAIILILAEKNSELIKGNFIAQDPTASSCWNWLVDFRAKPLSLVVMGALVSWGNLVKAEKGLDYKILHFVDLRLYTNILR